jgi:hypothetical protein
MHFGLYDVEGDPGPEWHLMSVAELNEHVDLFVAEYNQNGGLQAIKTFHSGNCCIAIAGGEMLVISDTMYGYQFPAGSGTVQCNPAEGYTGTYEFYTVPQLSTDQVFTGQNACHDSHNPGVFVLNELESGDTEVPAVEAPAGVQFGIYDSETSPGADWQLMGVEDFTEHRDAFIEQYNAVQGIAVIEPFHSGNCCFAVAGAEHLVISGLTCGYQFPASQDCGIQCNPSNGYSDEVYQFYTLPTLADDAMFSATLACSTSHNPGIYIRGHITPTPSPTASPTPVPTPEPVHCVQ